MAFPCSLSAHVSVRRQLLKHSGHGNGSYDYVDSKPGFGCIIEAIMLPRKMPEMECRFPPATLADSARVFDPVPRRFRLRVSALALCRARGETGDIVVDEEGVGDGDRN